MSLNRNEVIALENFKALVRYIAAENKLFWNRLSIFTAISSALVGVSFLDAVANAPAGPLVLSVFGLVLSILWLMITARSARYIAHWIQLAREIEEDRVTDLVFFKRYEEFLESCESWYEKMSVTRFCATGISYLFLVFWTFRLGACLSIPMRWVPMLWDVIGVLVAFIVLFLVLMVRGRNRNRVAIAIVAGGVSFLDHQNGSK